jgi:hypothetical protein
MKATYTSSYDSKVRVKAELEDPVGKSAARAVLDPIDSETLYGNCSLKIKEAQTWDAEHPRLYRLILIIEWDGEKTEQTSVRIGLRQIDRRGNKLFINGKEVKLRGICRHEIMFSGRCLTREIVRRDVALFKEANCNYIRTSHYPPCEYFLDLCDEQGIYAEDELPLAFIARTLDYTQRDPMQTDRYLSVFNEIYAWDCNHPSVLIWSLCKESFGGYNFDVMHRFAKTIDKTRPTKFSYPMTMREEHLPADIWSVHYANIDFDLGSKMDNVSVAGAPGRDRPVLHDEYAHVPCYNRSEHRRDPNVRAYWGESLDRFWRNIWSTDGALGGAIWAGIDDVNVFRNGFLQMEWGIIDVWRRRKPEHYMTRKAYSPVPVSLLPGNGTVIELENRFCHTNLTEIMIRWKYGNNEGETRGPDTEPCARAPVTLPLKKIPGVPLDISVTDAGGFTVDEYRFIPLPVRYPDTVPCTPPVLEDDNERITVTGTAFKLVFSRNTGLVEYGEAEGERILVGGPFFHAPYFHLGPWKLRSIRATEKAEAVRVVIHGIYEGSAELSFVMRIYGDGRIELDYTIEKLLQPLPHAEKLRVGTDCGGLDELGVAFTLVPSVDNLSWKRKGYHSVYPGDHIARNEGTAHRFSEGSEWGKEPGIPWALEMRSFILNGKYDVDYRGTNDFRSLKADIYRAAAFHGGGKGAFKALSGGTHSVRLEVEEPEEMLIHSDDPALRYTGSWSAVEDFRGSLRGVEMWAAEAGAACECDFEGTGIVWYGPVDTLYGIARVYIDGKLADDRVNQLIAKVDFPGSADGYDKKYNFPVFSVQDLPEGNHMLRVEATGEKGSTSKNSYIVIDHFRVLRWRGEEPVRFIILNGYNYPHIAWGNERKDTITPAGGYSNSITVKLGGV